MKPKATRINTQWVELVNPSHTVISRYFNYDDEVSLFKKQIA